MSEERVSRKRLRSTQPRPTVFTMVYLRRGCNCARLYPFLLYEPYDSLTGYDKYQLIINYIPPLQYAISLVISFYER